MQQTATATKKRLIDIAEIRHSLNMLVEPRQVFEIRALEASTQENSRYTDTLSGYFDNANDAIKALASLHKAMGIYITLQPCHPDLLDRAYNRLVKPQKGSSTSDNHIIGYRWLLIDCDPQRVSGISSTDEEHEQALARCRSIRDTLLAEGWPAPAFCDSGNGGHLAYRIDLPTSDSDLLKRVLEGLAKRFNQAGIHIDTTVFNPSRICKLYGTLACKGDDTPKRPHRLSRRINVPDTLTCVPRELLETVVKPIAAAAARPTVTTPSHQQEQTGDNLDWLTRWISEHHIDIVGDRRDYQGGYKWQVAQCPFCGESDNNAFLFLTSNGYGYNCSHNRCTGKGWQEFRLHHEPDAYTSKTKQQSSRAANSQDGEVKEGKQEKDKEEAASSCLMRIASDATYICTPSGALYARVPVNGHHEIVSINERGSGFKRWLVYRYKSLYGIAPNSDAISLVMSGVMADAEFTGKKANVHTRIAEHNGCIYLDLADEKWRCVEVSADSYRVITEPPVFFRRPNGMLPLPEPKPGGTLDDLKKIIHAESDTDYILIIAWLLGALHPRGPYPVLNLNGLRGSAKTYTTKILRNFIDPNEAPTRSSPKDPQSAAIMAQNNMVVALDNLSTLHTWLSDVLCRISTGSGYTTRALYENDQEIVFNARRPILINGIEDGIISQGDLLNRTMMVTLSPPDTYRTEEEMDSLFESLHPQLLGSLLSVVAYALKHRHTVQLEHPPRMADFAKWVVAAEPILSWQPGAFMEAFTDNQDNATSIVVESSPVAKALIQFMDHREGKIWEGYTEELFTALSEYEVFTNPKHSPKNARALSGQLKRIAPSMKMQDIDICQPKRDKHGSKVIIKCIKISSSGVANDGSDVANDGSDVAKNNFATSHISSFQADLAQSSNDGVANVAKCSKPSTLSEGLKKEEIEGKQRERDKERDFATLATLATSEAEDWASLLTYYADEQSGNEEEEEVIL